MKRKWFALLVLAMFAATQLTGCPQPGESNDTGTGSYDSSGGDDPMEEATGHITEQSDPLQDWIDSISEAIATFMSSLIDLVGFGAMTKNFSEAQAEQMNTLYPCGMATTAMVVCAATVTTFLSGNYYMMMMRLAINAPRGEENFYFVYSSVWDSDGDASNNWIPQGEYDWDTFQAADRWYQLNKNGDTGVWTLTVTQVQSNQSTQSVSSGARAIIIDDVIWFLIPEEELPAANPTYRPVTFGHPGDWDPENRGSDVSGANPTEPLNPVD